MKALLTTNFHFLVGVRHRDVLLISVNVDL